MAHLDSIESDVQAQRAELQLKIQQARSIQNLARMGQGN